MIRQYIFDKMVHFVDYRNKKKILIFFKNFFLNNKITVIDIGAHRGETIDFFLKNFSIFKIYSFEPNLNIFKKLQKKYASKSKIKISSYAIGEKNYKKKLNLYKDTSSSSFNEINRNSIYFLRKKKLSFDDYVSKKIITKVITLSNFIQKEKLNNFIDILKIDTEGYEYKILKGIKKKDFIKIKFIYFEHHYNNMILKNYKFSEINDFLIKNNFYMKKKIRMTFRKSFEYIYKNKNL